MSARPRSLAGLLLVLLIGAIALIGLAAAAGSFFSARKEVGEILDGHLAQAASLLIVQLGHELDEIDTERAPALHEDARKVAFQVWEQGRVLRLRSANAPAEALAGPAGGFSERPIAGRTWRVFSQWSSDRGYLVHVAERADAREKIARKLAARQLQPLLVAIPLLALLVWLAVRRALHPLRALARQIANREAQNLAPVEALDAPREVRPLIGQINALLARLGESIEIERRFTADAAHELRTPLAAVRTQAQVALAETAEAPRRHALDAVLAGCDRLARLTEQLLTLSRLENQAEGIALKTCALDGIAAQGAADAAPAALAKSIEISLEAQENVALRGQPDLLQAALRNLLDNAVRYCPAGAAVRIRVRADEGRARLTVEDGGPGIPEAERARVLERFHRILGSGAEGSGLGLAIVARVAELHRAQLELGDSPLGGLAVTLRFPAAGEERAD
ncbi:MAG TPA: two-component sensor histidine kinase [Rhodocyclaceae bacterium]|nr:two-component sensor histidine kinase [Rhodocyclaceae bacterium]